MTTWDGIRIFVNKQNHYFSKKEMNVSLELEQLILI